MPAKKAPTIARPPPSTKPLWQKLGVKAGETLHVLDLPGDVPRSLVEAADAHRVQDDLPSGKLAPGHIVLAFADSRDALGRLAKKLKPSLDGDVRVWIAYPKAGGADFNRDTGWEPIHALGLTGVMQVAVSDRWSALRFRMKQFVGR